MKVKTSKVGSLFIACTGYPNCKTVISLPKGIENVTMVEEKCQKCQRAGKQVKKFKLEFVSELINEAMGELLTQDDGTSGTFCVMPQCDVNYKTLVDQTYSLPQKRTFNEAFNQNPNGVPNYYYQKP